MESYAKARQKDRSNAEIIGQKRQEKALRDFKQVLHDLIFLLRNSTGMETCSLYWVNRSREQFVLETKATVLSNVMFQDRIRFEDHFLEKYMNITEPLNLEVGEDIQKEELVHYYDEISIRHLTLLPFINSGETVAITVLESGDHSFSEKNSEVIIAYISALRNMLNTYLEISDLYEKQEEWVDYEESLQALEIRYHRCELILRMINTIQEYLKEGGVSLISRGMRGWCNVLNSSEARLAPPIGMPLEKGTLAYEALQKGIPEFSIHFNNNPKRMSPRETDTHGASLAVPMMFHDSRQGLVLIYDRNPLIFKESTKHKIINLVRMTTLKIMTNEPNLEIEDPFLANEYNAFLPDLWERMVNSELERIRNESSAYQSWFGMITLENISSLRTKLRLEDLQQMQKELVELFSPNRYGISGVIGAHSDYTNVFFIQSKDRKAVGQWTDAVRKNLNKPLELANGIQIETSVKIGFTRVEADKNDSYEILQQAKKALSRAINKSGDH